MQFRMNLAHSILAVALMVPLLTSAQQSSLVPIITYDQEHPLVNNVNLLPMVQVFSSGEVVIYRGQGMINPGRYELTLPAADLAEIKALAESAGIPQLNVSELLEANSDSTALRVSSDPTTSTFEFNRVSGQNILSAGDGTTTDSTQSIVIDDVVFTASGLPSLSPVNSLKELHVRLIQLFSQAGQ